MRQFILCSIVLLFFACKEKETPRVVKEYSIEEFYNNTRIGGGAFSDDEDRLLVASDETGIFNVYEINLKDGSRRALTESVEESFFSVDYVPGTNSFLYSADKGGDEIDHIYLQSEDGTVTDLTPGEKAKANFAGWNREDTHMYYNSNARDPQYFDLYKMKIGDWNPEVIYKNTNGNDLTDWSEDEKYMAFSKTITTSSNELWLEDRMSNKKIQISNPDKPGSYSSSGFSKDNKSFYFITDEDAEFSYLKEMNLETGETSTVYQTDWDVMYSYLSKNETYRIIAINEDGKNSLVILDKATGKQVDFPDIKDGDITAVRVSDSEEKMRLSVGSSKSPNNLYLYDFKSKELTKLTETLNKNINPDNLVSAEVVRYKSFDGLEIPAIYYKPHIASKDNKVPALVWVHGGPGGQSRTGYFSLLQYLTNHGYAVLAVNNRGSSGYGKSFYKMDDKNHGDKDLKDCIAGKDWLASQDYINADQIGIIGGSYGGYMTMAAMAFTPEEFKVGVNIFGVTNWLRTLKSIPPYWESFRQALYEELGDPYSQDSVRLHAISPLFHTENIVNPVMVLQGANDPRVLQIESDEIVEGVRANNVPVEYVVFDDEGHGFIKKENEKRGYSQVLEFLDKYLRKENLN